MKSSLMAGPLVAPEEPRQRGARAVEARLHAGHGGGGGERDLGVVEVVVGAHDQCHALVVGQEIHGAGDARRQLARAGHLVGALVVGVVGLGSAPARVLASAAPQRVDGRARRDGEDPRARRRLAVRREAGQRAQHLEHGVLGDVLPAVAERRAEDARHGAEDVVLVLAHERLATGALTPERAAEGIDAGQDHGHAS
ncbi:MAG: hypothetical protein U1F43_09740 [Myxococcota bacterium]